jgi:hypothetical protein
MTKSEIMDKEMIETLRVRFEEWARWTHLVHEIKYLTLSDGSIEYLNNETRIAWRAFLVGFEQGKDSALSRKP